MSDAHQAIDRIAADIRTLAKVESMLPELATLLATLKGATA